METQNLYIVIDRDLVLSIAGDEINAWDNFFILDRAAACAFNRSPLEDITQAKELLILIQKSRKKLVRLERIKCYKYLKIVLSIESGTIRRTAGINQYISVCQ